MAKVDIEWRGLERLTATISNAHPKAVTQSLQVVKNMGEKGKSVSKRLAPVDTSFLKKSITTSYQGMEAHIKSGASYAGYQEYGTRYQPGTPHIRPMLDEIEPEFQRLMADVMKGAFK
ncbi:HK97-gp10 family putative phage morphogenesis protein [Streptococcus pluranimalium]|uniref:HK97-gp10 family putative phage morphogenesis protein n=1 Tax=Streptococcus pluranimalium TaxID=82348 RepID=UPI003F66F8DD